MRRRIVDSYMLSSMENYKLLERIGKGAQGSVYLAETRENQNKCVLKKIECHDESGANEAYREAVSLQALQHPYISSYKDFFVMWEKETSSMYLCIATQYYPEGDLSSVIKSYQEQKQPVEEEVVKKYLGEILEALSFVHKKGVIHRDLKPSNIFIQDDKTICLGDFGVESVMIDACNNTRNTMETKNYMAPEVSQKGYDEKSDIWSLGCILFELCTTFLYTGQEVTDKIREIRDDPLILEDVFEDIGNSDHFSGELICVIRSMLKKQHDKRKGTTELLEINYIKQCVEMSDVLMVEKRKRQAESRNTISSLSPEAQGLLAILEHIAKSIDHETHVREGLEQLVGLTEKEDCILLDDKSKKLIAMAMRNNINDKGVQIAGCTVLNNLIVKADAGDILYTPEIISVVPVAMKQHMGCPELQQIAAALLMALSADGGASEVIGQVGGIENILTAVRMYPDNSELCATCCSALWSLAVNESNLLLASNSKALKDVSNILENHILLPDVVESAAAAIVSLALDDSILEYVNEIDCVGHLINGISSHMKQSKVVKNSCMALTSLVVDEECAYRVLTAEDVDGVAGIPVIIKSYEVHKDNAEVVESIVNLIVELAEYEEACNDMNSYHVDESVKEMHSKFSQVKDIMTPCEKALDLLGNKTQKTTS
ncbi:serine/threonine kinase-like domain-containing protein STKLD1 isoform X2 [Patella vulgata]|uniref:serine/threonine kinase-like domain-containing protein STKLD1 isoform X2 n=1 Tax=Patella vulgata TaxID=6465 RepID=UPI0024A867F5|nr:serine/threonine kinase-like domain-containing protein STKLD1 isoform X2 [Patella vulgata]